MKKICIYGNPTIDIIELENNEVMVTYGGGSYYSSQPLIERSIDIEVYAVYSPLLSGHPVSKYIVKTQYSTNVNIFKLIYRGLERELILLDKAPSLYPWNMGMDCEYSILNPVIGEIDIGLLKNTRSMSVSIAVDIQGFLRERNGDRIYLKRNPIVLSVIEWADVIHMDIDEYRVLSGTSNVEDAFKQISKHLKGIIVVTEKHSAMLIRPNGYEIYGFEEKYNAINKTGAGDYFLSTYFYEYITRHDEEDALFKAHIETVNWLRNRDLAARSHRTPTTRKNTPG